MTLLEFSEKWVDEHIPTREIYGDAIKEKVLQLVDCFIQQGHNRASASATLSYFERLMKEYDNS